MKRNLLCLTLAILMFCGTMPFAYAASTEEIEAADALYELGLFRGTGLDESGNPEYRLDSPLSRSEAVTMLIRLLDKTEEAINGIWSTPFTDVEVWAEPYVGYAYANGLTAGTSATTYSGVQPATAAQYITFVLRALGYTSGIDFEYSNAWVFSDKIGLTQGQYNENTTDFSRGDAVLISYNALNCKFKNSNQTLLDSLGGAQSKAVKFDKAYEAVDYYKIKGNIYTDDYFRSELNIYAYGPQYYVAFNPTLYFKRDSDTRIEGAVVCILALANNLYEIRSADNPYTSGEIMLDLRPYDTLGMTISQKKTYSNIDRYETSYTYSYRGKELSTPTDENAEFKVDGVSFVRHNGGCYVEVNDFLGYFGFNKTVSMETTDGHDYLVIQ